jgi:hypothetical protein
MSLNKAHPSLPPPRIPLYDDPNHVAYGWQQMDPILDFLGMFALRKGGARLGSDKPSPLGSQQVEELGPGEKGDETKAARNRAGLRGK